MHSMLSQDITTIQKKRIDSIFTAEKIIDISKGLSNEKLQDSIIKVRDIQIKELEAKIISINKEYTKTLIEIANNNSVVAETSFEIDGISDEQLKKERLKWSGLHLYGGIEVPKFEFNTLSFNSELMYELEKIEFGLKANLNNDKTIDKENYQFNYYLKLRYKFF